MLRKVRETHSYLFLSLFSFSKEIFLCFFFALTGGHHQDAKVRVNIKVKDVNDNPPEFATNNEVLVCENVVPGKVSVTEGS